MRHERGCCLPLRATESGKNCTVQGLAYEFTVQHLQSLFVQLCVCTKKDVTIVMHPFTDLMKKWWWSQRNFTITLSYGHFEQQKGVKVITMLTQCSPVALRKQCTTSLPCTGCGNTHVTSHMGMSSWGQQVTMCLLFTYLPIQNSYC